MTNKPSQALALMWTNWAVNSLPRLTMSMQATKPTSGEKLQAISHTAASKALVLNSFDTEPEHNIPFSTATIRKNVLCNTYMSNVL